MMTLYFSPGACSLASHIGLEETGAPYEIKPILLANVRGFWDPLITVFEHLRDSAFLPAGRQLAYIAVDTVEKILPTLAAALAQVEERELQGEPERVRRL
jgi:predicted Rossmann-fold nucleotide-binding protein